MKRLLLMIFAMALLIPCVAQNDQEALVSVVDLLQYERTKQKGGEPASPFRRYDMKRIKASKVLEEGDSRHLWGYHVKANLEYDKDSQPLFRIFKRVNMGSIAVIDYLGKNQRKCEVIFWGKRYYRRFAHDLRRMGFEISNSRVQSNILEFRKEGVSVGVDMIVWPEIYIMRVCSLGNTQ